MKETKLEYKLSKMEEEAVSSELQGKVYVFTGVRDNILEQMITSKGGIIGNTITKSTYKLIAKSMDTTSSKIKKALSLNVPISIYPDY